MCAECGMGRAITSYLPTMKRRPSTVGMLMIAFELRVSEEERGLPLQAAILAEKSPFPQTGFEQLQCAPGEGPHVLLAQRSAGFDGDHRLDRSAHRDAGMSGRIAIAIAGRPARSGL